MSTYSNQFSKIKWNFSQNVLTLTGINLLEIHKRTLEIINGNSTDLTYSLKQELEKLPVPLQKLLLEDVETTNCNSCRLFMEEDPIFENLENGPIDRYIFYLKNGVTLGSDHCKAGEYQGQAGSLNLMDIHLFSSFENF